MAHFNPRNDAKGLGQVNTGGMGSGSGSGQGSRGTGKTRGPEDDFKEQFLVADGTEDSSSSDSCGDRELSDMEAEVPKTSKVYKKKRDNSLNVEFLKTLPKEVLERKSEDGKERLKILDLEKANDLWKDWIPRNSSSKSDLVMSLEEALRNSCRVGVLIPVDETNHIYTLGPRAK